MVKIELDPFERELILKFGYPSPGLKTQIERIPNSRAGKVSFDRVDIHLMTGDLSRSINHGEVPNKLIDAVDALCGQLEAYL